MVTTLIQKCGKHLTASHHENFYLASDTFPPINLSLMVCPQCITTTIELMAHSAVIKYKDLGYLAKEGLLNTSLVNKPITHQHQKLAVYLKK